MARTNVSLLNAQARADYSIFMRWCEHAQSHLKIKDSSLNIYRSMWAKLVAGTDHDVSTLTEDQLDVLVRKSSSDSKTSYPKRMSQLVSRVMAYHYQSTDLSKSKGFEKFHERFDDLRPTAPKYANSSKREHYKESIEHKLHWPSMDWKEKRNMAIAAVGLFAGLKLSEIIRLRFKDVQYIPHLGQFHIHVHGSMSRVVPLHLTGTRHINEWISARLEFLKEEKRRDDSHFFVSTQSGKPISRVTAYRSIKDVLGLSTNSARNTFAVTNIANGHASELVAQWLGYRMKENLEKFTTDQSLMAFMKTISS